MVILIPTFAPSEIVFGSLLFHELLHLIIRVIKRLVNSHLHLF